jgi:metal-responsive CopG/Arc/MetJ family transcriptional regulator
MNRYAISIPDEYIEKLDKAAKNGSRSRSDLIREAIKQFTDELDHERETRERREAAWRDMDEIRAKTKTEGFNSTEFLREWRYRDAR